MFMGLFYERILVAGRGQFKNALTVLVILLQNYDYGTMQDVLGYIVMEAKALFKFGFSNIEILIRNFTPVCRQRLWTANWHFVRVVGLLHTVPLSLHQQSFIIEILNCLKLCALPCKGLH